MTHYWEMPLLLVMDERPVFYPSEEEFKDPLEYIYKIRPEAEPYGICKIVPPRSWKPPFALDRDSFTFPTKSQAIHQLQARCAPCDPKTFRLEYNRFLEEHCGKKAKKRVVFEGEDLDLCKLFNAVKRFGGYDNAVKVKKWAEVFRFIRPGRKISECSKHVLSQLYREHLFDYEEYYCRLNKVNNKSCKRGMSGWKKCEPDVEVSSVKRRRKNKEGERVEVRKVEEEELDQICEQCRSGLHGEVMLLCDRCNKGWHIYCLSPPLKKIPPGNWYCLECLNSEKESFGFVPGKQYSLEAFRRVADRVKKKWFGSAATSWVQLEKKFWEIVEGSVGEVEVMYGSDLDTSVYGSGFPRQIDQRPPLVEVDAWNEYCASPWNLNNLPRLHGSMLRAVHQNIAGVMRSSLPDLFEAQPDLLFQLVTMLNPSVLQEKGVPVYSIIQCTTSLLHLYLEILIHFVRAGLNCAEAVNFAPADWLPHGGFGAELYRHYHKVPVLSHEELLCAVAKSELDSRVSKYLKKELLRIYNNEKTWRERLWRNGIIRSSAMTPRVKPSTLVLKRYTDPVCVICQQLLYLSAVSCNCRPSAYVCLEVKGGHVTHLQLAEEWILRSCKILEHPYSRHAYVSAIEEAEQFLWAGSEMDLVREMQNNLIQAQIWAKAVRDCLFKVKLWSSYRNCDTERVQMDDVNELLRFSTAPCNEPGHLQLKVVDLEILYLKTVDSPIYIKESEKLKVKLSAVKVWLDNVRNCISQKAASSVEVDMLYKLESEELVLESTDLNVHCEECSLLEKLLKKSVEWEQDASTLLQNAENLWNSDIIGDVITSSLIPRLECQVLSMETTIKDGISLGLEFNMIPKLQDACSTSKWCIKALSFSTIIPTRKEVEMMLDAAASLPLINKSSALWTALIDGLSWLKKSLEILDPNNQGQFQVSSVEELFLLSKLQKICISFPMIIDRLQDAVHNHKTDERRILHQIVEKALACNACLTELVNFALAYVSKDLNVVTQKIHIALKAMDVAGICDDEGNRKFELSLARSSWKIRAEKLLGSAEKPTLQQIQNHLKEGLAMNIPPEDYFTQKLTEHRNMALQWAETAKKVSADGGMLGLDKVFELISEGESLPVYCGKELKVTTTIFSCLMLFYFDFVTKVTKSNVCAVTARPKHALLHLRRPYDRRAMIACDKCDEWYHFDCIKISSAPKVYICPACNPNPEETMCASAPNILERQVYYYSICEESIFSA
ncbi:hypothetical protein DH2020_036189 [Rehmannia glutinosa]|uniref:[histone H3]-trimethyl-L-lysine(4) demethylase n=1 Tax=Rehmannia glutinosa TaxID=99300 RepID=A0ABR0V7L5_REHGL